MHIALALFHDREGTHPHHIACALRERDRCGTVAGEGVQVDRGGIEWRDGSIACEVGEQRMRQQVRGVGHRPAQHLLQVAHGGEQTPRVCEFPAPPGVLWKGECQATRLPLGVLPWPELGTDWPGVLLWIGMDTHHPAAARLLKPGTGGGPRKGRGWHHPDRVEPSVPEVVQQAIRLTHVSGKLERSKHALAPHRLKE
jgi:hypothetical protein